MPYGKSAPRDRQRAAARIPGNPPNRRDLMNHRNHGAETGLRSSLFPRNQGAVSRACADAPFRGQASDPQQHGEAQRLLRQPNHIPSAIPPKAAAVNFFRSLMGTKRVCCSLTSTTPTGMARTPPPPPPPSPRALFSPMPPRPAHVPYPYIIELAARTLLPCAAT